MFHLAGVDVRPLLDAVLEQAGFWALASLAVMLHVQCGSGCLYNAFATGKNKNCELLNQRINDWVGRYGSQLSAFAEKAIVFLVDLEGRAERYEIEESLCALYDGKVMGACS